MNRVICIDGPAGAGKSTVARAVAKRLGYLYVDSGALYRVATWKALRDGVDTGELITGYVLMCYVKSARRIYMLHFTAPSRRYDDLSVIIDVIRDSMTTTNT